MNNKISYADLITQKLQDQLSPSYLTLIDDSHKHAGHIGYKGDEGETHFSLTIISDKFENLSIVSRHRMIYKILENELKSHVHALAIKALTQKENIKY